MDEKLKDLEQFLHHMPICFILQDEQKKCWYANQKATIYLQDYLQMDNPTEFIKGKKLEEIFTSVKECQQIEENIDWVIDNQIPITYITKERIQITRSYWEITHVPLVDENNVLIAIITACMSLEGETLINQALLNSYQEIDTFYHLFKEKYTFHSHPIYHTISELIDKYIDAEFLSLYWYDPENSRFILEKSKGYSDAYLKTIVTENINKERIAREFAKSIYGQVYPVSEIEDKKRRKLLILEGVEYIGLYPIQIKDYIVGLLSIGFKKSHSHQIHYNVHINNICIAIAMILVNNRLISILTENIQKQKEEGYNFELFFNESTDLLCILDDEGRFKRINTTWTEKLGYCKEELIGHTYDKVLHKAELHYARGARFKRNKEKSIYNYITKIKCKDESFRWVSWDLKKEDVGVVPIYIAVGRDITQKKLTDKSNAKMIYEMHKQQGKNEFFTIISHDFKTPLNILLSTVQLIERYLEDQAIIVTNKKTIIDTLQRIKKNIFKLLKMINDSIDLTRIEMSSYPINKQNWDIIATIEDMLLCIAKQLEHMNIEIIFDTMIEEKIIWCDKKAIERIIINIVYLVNLILCKESKDKKIWTIIAKVKQYIRVTFAFECSKFSIDKLEEELSFKLVRALVQNIQATFKMVYKKNKVIITIEFLDEKEQNAIVNVTDIMAIHTLMEKWQVELSQF